MFNWLDAAINTNKRLDSQCKSAKEKPPARTLRAVLIKSVIGDRTTPYLAAFARASLYLVAGHAARPCFLPDAQGCSLPESRR